MTSTLYRNVRPEQDDLVNALTERYASQKIRFDTGFNGSIPVQSCGRIGRQYFYFRFRGDCASLTLGTADLRRSASRAKYARRKALRELRRGRVDDSFFGFLTKRDLRRDTSLDRHPSRAAPSGGRETTRSRPCAAAPTPHRRTGTKASSANRP